MNSTDFTEELITFSLLAMLFLFFIFPIIYITIKQGTNRFLFCCACIGAILLIFSLLYLFSLPFVILIVKAIPQLAEYGQVVYILPLLRITNLIQQYHLIVLYPLLNLLLPTLIYKRYPVFKKTKAT